MSEIQTRWMHGLLCDYEVVDAAVARDLYAACEAFTAAMRVGTKPDMLLLIEALHKTDAALAAARGESNA